MEAIFIAILGHELLFFSVEGVMLVNPNPWQLQSTLQATLNLALAVSLVHE